MYIYDRQHCNSNSFTKHEHRVEFDSGIHNTMNNFSKECPVELHKEIRGNKTAEVLARLRADQPLVDPEAVVGISYTQTKKYFRLWEEKNNRKSWIEAKSFRQARAFNDKEQPHRWRAGLLQLRIWEAKTLGVWLRVILKKINHLRHKTGRGANHNFPFCEWKRKLAQINSLTVRHCRKAEEEY